MIFFQNNQSSLLRLLFNLKINKLSPSLHLLSQVLSLLRLSLPPVLRTILYDCFPASWRVSSTVPTSLVPNKTLYCIPVPFTPDAVFQQSSPLIHSFANTNVATCFRHHSSLSRLNRRFNLFSSAIRTYKNLCSRFYLSFTTTNVSVQCSISWFANYSWQSFAEVQSFVWW